jgi:hypothetical protein
MHFQGRTTNAKPVDSFRLQQETWRRAYAEAHSLRERCPTVEQLVVNMAFADLKQTGTYSGRMHSFSASAKAFFAIACPRTLCLGGGFDLDPLILDLLGTGGTTSTGTLECRGWLDSARPAHAQCRLQALYRFEVRYNAGAPSASNRRTRD